MGVAAAGGEATAIGAWSRMVQVVSAVTVDWRSRHYEGTVVAAAAVAPALSFGVAPLSEACIVTHTKTVQER